MNQQVHRIEEGNASSGLCAADFTRIAANGFDDPENSYAHSMVCFQNCVYVGTLRNAFPLLKLFPPADPPVMDPWPVRTVEKVEDLNLLAQIWRYDLARKQWEKVFTSPVIPRHNGQPAPRDIGYRGMAVFRGRRDASPGLFVSTISTVLRGTAALILRSEDGEHFEAVSEPGLGNPNVSTFRSLIAFDDRLFVAPVGEGTTWNTTCKSVIMRSADPVGGSWEPACIPGFGDPTNNGVFELAVFNDHLYAGTFNHYAGFQIWKTPATGRRSCRWTRVIERGAYRGNLNEMPLGMCAFDGALFVGTGIQNGGYDRNNRIGPAAGELIRIYPDDSWELIVGTPRRTPDGMKYPLSGMGPGFDNFFAGYIWRMVVHEKWLYVSTFDWSMFLAYARRPPQQVRRMMQRFGVDELIRLGSGFQLWRTHDGRNWIPVTRTGMGNPYNHGGRTLLSTPDGLFVGTANPFGPQVAAKLSTGWTYVPNPNGGAEVWLGRSRALREHQVAENPEQRHGQLIVVRHGVHEDSRSARVTKRVRRERSGSAPRVLLTGATGFIGSHVLEQILSQEDRIRVYALPETVPQIRHPDRVEIVIGDLSESASLRRAVAGIETVYHLAALLPGSPHTELMRVNMDGTEHLLQASSTAGNVRRFVFTSSVAVYEGAFYPEAWPLTEVSQVRPRGPQSLRSYGLSKAAAERCIQEYAGNYGFEYVVLRPSTSYGQGSKLMEDLVRRVLADPWAGTGRLARQTMQLIHVRDLAEVIARAGVHPAAANGTFNVSGTETYMYRNIAAMIRRLAGFLDEGTLLPDPSRIWRRYVLIYDVEKAQKQLGFNPRVTLHEGLAEVVTEVLGSGAAVREPQMPTLWTYC